MAGASARRSADGIHGLPTAVSWDNSQRVNRCSLAHSSKASISLNQNKPTWDIDARRTRRWRRLVEEVQRRRQEEPVETEEAEEDRHERPTGSLGTPHGTATFDWAMEPSRHDNAQVPGASSNAAGVGHQTNEGSNGRRRFGNRFSPWRTESTHRFPCDTESDVLARPWQPVACCLCLGDNRRQHKPPLFA